MNLESPNGIDTHLRDNPYPGRGLIQGKSTSGQWIQVYWMMGRSVHSRNRVLVYKDGMIQTQLADPTMVPDDTTLLLYAVMREHQGQFIVSNGTQTDVIYNGFEKRITFQESLFSQSHEPDVPHFTPRISGCLSLSTDLNSVEFSKIQSSPLDRNNSEYQWSSYSDVVDGWGYGLTTYQTDGHPLPSFEGPPLTFPLAGEMVEIANTYWHLLNPENRVSLAVKSIDPHSLKSSVVIFNRFIPGVSA